MTKKDKTKQCNKINQIILSSFYLRLFLRKMFYFAIKKIVKAVAFSSRAVQRFTRESEFGNPTRNAFD